MTNENREPMQDIPSEIKSYFDQDNVELDLIPIGEGIPFGMTRVSNRSLGIGGAYGTWGKAYDNKTLPNYLSERLGKELSEDQKINLAPLGFLYRHHIPDFSDPDHYEVELEVGSRFIRAAAEACGWDPSEVDAVLIGMSGPVDTKITEHMARRAGIREDALKVSVHKACDSSVSALHLVLNPELYENNQTNINLAKELVGKKVLVGGIEGLSRFAGRSKDLNALQLFGNGAGVIGVIPGQSMKFLVGESDEVFDKNGLLAVQMFYPYSRDRSLNGPMVEVTQESSNHLRVAGRMKEPSTGYPVEMAGLMGMVKLFVRSGVVVVRKAYEKYSNFVSDMGLFEKSIRVAIVHHANYKINLLKKTQLVKDGINLTMPWLLSEFGNVSAASNMIAFLRELPSLNPGDHILFDGFGAGTYYDVFATALGES